jgi:subtilisin family serine protease
MTVMNVRLTRLTPYALLLSIPFAAATSLRARAATEGDRAPEFRSLTLSPDLTADDGPLAPKERLTDAWRKVAAPLRSLVVQASKVAKSGDRTSLSSSICPVRADGSAGSAIRVTRFGDPERAALVDAGCEVTFERAGVPFVEAWVPIDALERVASLDFVSSVRPVDLAVTSAGSVTSEGDAIMGCADVRRVFGVTGRGVKVGVISDSADGILSAIASGDVPADVQILRFGEGIGEGTAMLEIVHDLAPDATLAFAGASTAGDIIHNIDVLTAAGCQVIVDDLKFRGDPYFEEGPVAQAMDDAVAHGVVYVSHAGNDALTNDQRDFHGIGSIGGPTRNVEGFENNSGVNAFTVPPNSRYGIIMQWSNPDGFSSDDYDLYIADATGTIVAKSDNPQDGDDTPLEVTGVLNATSSPQTFYAIIDLYSGSPQRVNVDFDRSFKNIQFHSRSGSIGCNQKARDAICVGAIPAYDPGHDNLELFSSEGPCDVFFPTFERRSKPDVCGIDGVRITGAAGFQNPFFGTSAAAPHVAGVVALMLSADPSLDPASVKLTLQRSAVDCGPPGYDSSYGWGRADAVSATIGYPNAEAAGFSGTRLVVQGTHFAPGAVILVNGRPYRTRADAARPTTVLVSRPAARAIQPGQTVTLQVQNPDGRLSLPANFSR